MSRWEICVPGKSIFTAANGSFLDLCRGKLAPTGSCVFRKIDFRVCARCCVVWTHWGICKICQKQEILLGNLFRRRRDGSKSHRLAVGVAVPLQRFRRRLQHLPPALQGVPPFVVVAAPAGREHIVRLVSIFSAPYGEEMIYLHICIGKITPAVGAMPAEFVVDGAAFHRRQLPPCAHFSISARRPSLM